MLRVLQYNTAWWVLNPRKNPRFELEKKCKKRGRNLCKENIINLIKYTNSDLISLNEASESDANEILNILNNEYLNKYSIIIRKVKKNTKPRGVIIYNKNILNPIPGSIQIGNLDERSTGRPYIFQEFLFNKSVKIIFGTLHAPHGLNTEYFSFFLNKILSNFSINDNTNIIIAGDFNHFLRKQNLFKSTNLISLNTGYKTCCNLNRIYNTDSYSTSYNYAYDNILINKNLSVKYGPEYLGDGKNKLFPPNDTGIFRYHNNSSDHLPMIVELDLNYYKLENIIKDIKDILNLGNAILKKPFISDEDINIYISKVNKIKLNINYILSLY